MCKYAILPGGSAGSPWLTSWMVRMLVVWCQHASPLFHVMFIRHIKMLYGWYSGQQIVACILWKDATAPNVLAVAALFNFCSYKPMFCKACFLYQFSTMVVRVFVSHKPLGLLLYTARVTRFCLKKYYIPVQSSYTSVSQVYITCVCSVKFCKICVLPNIRCQ